MTSLFRLKKTVSSPLPGEESGTHLIGGLETPYIIQRKGRHHRIALYIEVSGRLRFVTPLRTRTQRITEILDTRNDWIAGKLHHIRLRPPPPSVPRQFRDGEIAYYLGNPYKLKIFGHSPLPQGCRITDGQIEIHLSGGAIEEDARLELLLWYKKQAKQTLQERTDYWADRLELKYRSVKVTNPLRQWGSCSVKNDIRYNWRVIVGPMEAVDYLVAHELCHITHKNHSPRFWSLLATVMPDHKKRRKILHAMDTGFSL